MPINKSLIESLQQIAGAKNVLTEAEDIYVYSFEHFYQEKRHHNLAAVVRVTAHDKLKELEETAARSQNDVMFVRRSSWKPETSSTAKDKPTIQIDDAIQPELNPIDADDAKKNTLKIQKELENTGYGGLRNYAVALNSFLSNLPSQKCINCQTCSGYCTVSSAFNGVETWSSKGRTLLTRAFFSDELPPSAKLAQVLYTCSLCGLCFAQCFETTQVRKAIMEARRRLVEKGRTPELFTATAKSIFEVGDPSGMAPSKRVAWARELPQKGVFPRKADLLYWSGCVVSTRTPNVAKALDNILNRVKADFTFLGENEGCCGYVLLATGLWNEAKENAQRLVERISGTEAETLVTTCAGCYYTFTKLYPEILDVKLPCKVVHAAQFVESLVKEGAIRLQPLNWKVTYHDPCSLGRHCNVYDSPRNVLNAVPSLDFVEMPLNRNLARCCGAGGGLWSFNNALALTCAHERLVKDAAPLGVSALVTACPTCHLNFRYASVKKALGIKVYDLVEIVDSAMATDAANAS